jgi:O-antigen ligase
MVSFFFILWVSAIPLIVWESFFEGPKVFTFLILGLVLSFYWILKAIKNKKIFVLEKKDAWFWAWLLILTVSSLTGVHPAASILGGSYRRQGVLLFLSLWLVGKTTQSLDVKKQKLLHKVIGLAVLTEALIVFYQILSGKLYLGKPLGTIGEANAVSGMLAIGSYFVFVSLPRLLSVIPLTAIALTQSRTGILAALPNLFILIGSLGKKIKLAVSILIIFLTGTLFIYFSGLKGVSPFENRQVIWPMAVQTIMVKPLLGYGAESGEVVFANAFYKSGIPLSNLTIDRAHNLFLDVLMWSGVFGLIAFLGWLYLSFTNIKDWGRRLGFLSFLIYSFFQPLSVVHWLLFVLII